MAIQSTKIRLHNFTAAYVVNCPNIHINVMLLLGTRLVVVVVD